MAHQSTQAAASVATMKKWKRFVVVAGTVIIVVALATQLKKSVSGWPGMYERKPNIERIPIILKGDSVFTGSVPLPNTGKVYLLGPITSRVKDGYGNVTLVNQRHGDIYGPLSFAGPKGDTAFVDLVPER